MAGEQIRVLVKVPATQNYGEFNDAIYLDRAAFDAMSLIQIEALKTARYTSWTVHINQQNAINRDPSVIARRQAEEAAERAATVTAIFDSSGFDAIITRIVAAVTAGNFTPPAVRAFISNPNPNPNRNPNPNPNPMPGI